MQELKTKKEPLRKCTVCGEHRAKKELLRVVRTPEGGIILDLKGKANGRGAYICRSEKCLMKTRKSGRLASALSVPIPEEIYEALSEEIAKGDGNE